MKKLIETLTAAGLAPVAAYAVIGLAMAIAALVVIAVVGNIFSSCDSTPGKIANTQTEITTDKVEGNVAANVVANTQAIRIEAEKNLANAGNGNYRNTSGESLDRMAANYDR